MSAQIATNAAALRNLADRLERLGYAGDCYAEAEHIAVNLLADGYKPVERSAPPVGSGSTPEHRQAVLDEARRLIDASRRTRGSAQAGNNGALDSGVQL